GDRGHGEILVGLLAFILLFDVNDFIGLGIEGLLSYNARCNGCACGPKSHEKKEEKHPA
ncbi:MAG: hypothetical protein JRL30_23770, partial [Deltaproteobacteria bacterium]|nr:hypothetical protein [Deltaproteobacteria bacterium]